MLTRLAGFKPEYQKAERMMRGFWAIVYKEILQIRRDPSTRFVFVIPAIQTIIFGFAIDMDVQHIPTMVYDMDRSVESRRLVESFANTNTFDVIQEVAGEPEIRRQIVAGRAKVGILVPPDYSAKLLRGEQATVQVLVDGSDSSVATNAVQTALGVGQVQSLIRAGINPSLRSLDVRPWVLFNPNLDSSHFYVPGIIGIILQVVTVFLTAFAVVRERERGTLEQLVVTPVSKWALIIGKLVPYSILGVAQTVFVLVLMRYLFGVPVELGQPPRLRLQRFRAHRGRHSVRGVGLRGPGGTDQVHGAQSAQRVGPMAPAFATGYLEWVMGDQRWKSARHVFTEVDPTSDVLLARNPYSTEFSDRVAFFKVDATTRK